MISTLLGHHHQSAATDRRVCVQIGEIRIAVQSDLDAALDEFLDLYGECQCPYASADQVIHMEIRAQGRSRIGTRRYAIWGDSQQVFQDCRHDEALPYLEWGINRTVIESRSDFLQLHAATLVRDGQAVIFPGGSGAGKSTLAAALLSRGWTYLCDEFALVNPGTMCVHPFPKALCIKAGSFAVVQKLRLPLGKRRYYVRAFDRRVAYVRPPRGRALAAASPVPIRWIIFPQYSQGDKPRLTAVSRGQAAFALASLAMNRMAFGPGTTAAVGAVVRHADCFRLDCGHLEPTCDLVESLLA